MKRLILIAGITVLAVMGYLQTASVQSNVTVTNAQAVPMGASGTIFMVTLDMQNDGPAVTLTDVRSPSGADVSVMNPAFMGAPLTIPADGTGLLAMDGAHVMLSLQDGSFSEGTFQPLSLSFDDGSQVVTRVIRTKPSGMRHGMSDAVGVSPAPSITLVPPDLVDGKGFEVGAALENFEFVIAPDDAAHVDGQGHAHIYLNGLKLGRLYEDRFNLGALSAGDYTLRVALNTNDHRPYADQDAPVEAVWTFTVP